MSSKKTQYMEPGACFAAGNFKRCALDSTFCDASLGEEYLSPAKQKLQKLEAPCKNVENIAVGKCSSGIDDAACTGHISSCMVPNFITVGSVEDIGCTVTHNKNSENELPVSVYGACIDERTQTQKCYWSIDDCPHIHVNNSFVPGSSQHLSSHYSPAKLCTCDKTLIGACQYPSGYTCAVSRDACDVSGQYISAADMEANPSAPNCYLCAPFGKSNFGKYEAPGGSQKETSIIIIITIVSIALVTLALLTAFCVSRRCCRRRGASKEMGSTSTDVMSVDPIEVEIADLGGTGHHELKVNPII